MNILGLLPKRPMECLFYTNTATGMLALHQILIKDFYLTKDLLTAANLFSKSKLVKTRGCGSYTPHKFIKELE
jgi:hypothetical protein